MNSATPPRRIALPGTDLEVSPICLGTGDFGTGIREDAAFALLDRMVELGGCFIDTANNYGNWDDSVPRSASEKLIGKWLSQRTGDERIVVATKGGHPHFDQMEVGRLSREEILRDIEGSREALGLEKIDLYYLHVDDLSKSVPPIMDALFEARSRGWVGALGASNWKVSRLMEAQSYADSVGVPGFVADQTLWNAAVLAVKPYGSDSTGWMNQSRFEFLKRRSMAAIPYQSQAFGLFHRMAQGALDEMNQGFRGFYREDEARRRLSEIQRITREKGLSLTQGVLGYLLSQPIPVSAIVGCKSIRQVEDSFSALHVQLSPEDLFAIDLGHKGSELPES
jgi:aryl-alcohol dehydrogenase-like predicted oxidoreductase